MRGGKVGKEKEVRMKKKNKEICFIRNFFKSVFDFVSSFLTFSGSIACTRRTCLSFGVMFRNIFKQF